MTIKLLRLKRALQHLKQLDPSISQRFKKFVYQLTLKRPGKRVEEDTLAKLDKQYPRLKLIRK